MKYFFTGPGTTNESWNQRLRLRFNWSSKGAQQAETRGFTTCNTIASEKEQKKQAITLSLPECAPACQLSCDYVYFLYYVFSFYELVHVIV